MNKKDFKRSSTSIKKTGRRNGRCSE